jgi:hypothetical protein
MAAIQTAYEPEASAGSALHDEGLQILQAKCHDKSADGFLREVTFISKGDPTERLYFDIVAVPRAGNGWTLKNGCASADGFPANKIGVVR